MKLNFLVLLLLIPISSFSQAAPPSALTSSADEFSEVLSGGYEVETDRKYLELELSSGEPAYVVFFTLEGHAGTSAYHQWAALFTASNNDSGEQFSMNQFALVGNSGWRSLDYSRAIERQGKIQIPFKTWKQSDKVCCPTGSGTGHLKYTHGEVVFVE